MRSAQAGLTALRVLEYLDDWKDAWDLARDLQIPVEEARAILRDLCKKGLVFRDGHKYMRRWGV